MDNRQFDTLARALGGNAPRRALLGTAGASALGAFGLATLGLGGANAKKGGTKGKGTCQKQVGRCREGLAELCAALLPEPSGNFDAEDCAETFGPCCQALSGCNAAQAFDCAVAKFEELQQKQSRKP